MDCGDNVTLINLAEQDPDDRKKAEENFYEPQQVTRRQRSKSAPKLRSTKGATPEARCDPSGQAHRPAGGTVRHAAHALYDQHLPR